MLLLMLNTVVFDYIGMGTLNLVWNFEINESFSGVVDIISKGWDNVSRQKLIYTSGAPFNNMV